MLSTTALQAEDDDDLAEALTRALERVGYQVRRARTGDDALTLARGAAGLDLAVVDLVLPGAGGLDVVREVRRGFPACRILAVTGVDAPAVETAFREAGADVFLVKPVELGALLRAAGGPAA